MSQDAEPLVRPPSLHVGRSGSASRLELFFDLAYVLVVVELVSAFTEDVSWRSFAALTGLFVAIWFSWVGFTVYGNRFDTDDVVYRLGQLAGTLSIAGCAASASQAVGAYAVPFAVSFLVGRVVLLLLYVRARRHMPEARSTLDVYLATTGASTVAWAVSIGVDGNARYLIWAVAVVLGAVGPVLATLRRGGLPLHVEHLPERFALLVILVLGEAVGGAARGVHDMHWTALPIVLGVLGFVIAAGLWWIYFDTAADASTPRLEQSDEEADDPHSDGAAATDRHDAFVYGHLPLTLGIVLVGVGVEEQILHPDDAPAYLDWLLAGGLLLFLTGIALVVGGTVRSWRSVWPWPLIGVPLVTALALIPHTSALVLVIGYAVLITAIAALGTHRQRRESAS